MKITVMTGSPHKQGSSNLLAEQFIKGAEESGAEVFRFDTAFKDVSPCLGCDKCDPSFQCFRKDDIEELKPHLFASDIIVFVTPIYFFSMSAQLKIALDRWYAFGSQLAGGGKKTVLMAVSHSGNEVAQALVAQYQGIISYMGWQDAGQLLLGGCAVREDVEQTDYPKKAYELGKKLGSE
jgi:multimeric flavodoxin WrbA